MVKVESGLVLPKNPGCARFARAAMLPNSPRGSEREVPKAEDKIEVPAIVPFILMVNVKSRMPPIVREWQCRASSSETGIYACERGIFGWRRSNPELQFHSFSAPVAVLGTEIEVEIQGCPNHSTS